MSKRIINKITIKITIHDQKPILAQDLFASPLTKKEINVMLRQNIIIDTILKETIQSLVDSVNGEFEITINHPII